MRGTPRRSSRTEPLVTAERGVPAIVSQGYTRLAAGDRVTVLGLIARRFEVED